MSYECQRVYLPANQPLTHLATILDAARPDGARLVSVAPDGSHVSPGTYLVVWEVPAG